VDEPKSLPPRVPLRTGRIISPRRRMIFLGLLGAIVLGEAVWAGVTYWQSKQKPELIVYHLCLGSEARLCPPNLTFVRDQGEETLNRWAQRECSGYKARHIIVNDGPSKECNCSLADITCATEY
jgi:hypothetical protein